MFDIAELRNSFGGAADLSDRVNRVNRVSCKAPHPLHHSESCKNYTQIHDYTVTQFTRFRPARARIASSRR